MSKFHDAMERAAGRVAEPKVEPGDLGQQDEELVWAIRTLDVAKSDQTTPRFYDPEAEYLEVDPEINEETEVVSEETVAETPEDRVVVDRPPVSRPKVKTIKEQVMHPAYERIIQKLITFRRSPRQGVILVAGAVPGEGASTVARNTAVALGRGQGEHVVLVDANVRDPVQYKAFDIENADGLSDVLRGTSPLTSALHPDVRAGLSLLTAGRQIDAPPQILTITSLQGLVMALTSLFHWVVIDGPPVTTCPEAATLATASGGALLVVRAEKTRQEVAEEAKRVLEDSGVDVLGAVLNRRKYHIPSFLYRRL